MKRKCFFLILVIVVFCNNFSSVKALTYGGCEYSEIVRLKSIVSNVNLTYDYYIKDNEAYFNIKLSNIVPDIYFVDSKTNITYTYRDAIDGEIVVRDYKHTKGSYKFYSALSKCYGVKLSNKYYQLPTYNRYYYDPLCEQNRNYSLCQKWIKVNYSYNDFKKSVEKYNNKNLGDEEQNNSVIYEKNIFDEIVGFYIKYYYIILIAIILICTVVMVINRRKNRFNI